MGNDDTIATVDDSLIDDILALETTQSSMDNTFETSDIDTSANTSGHISSPLRVTAAPHLDESPASPPADTPQMNNSKGLEFGTPLINSISPFSKLPTGDSWSNGVSDIIDFENLPDSTGKYLQMKSVLSKVRDAVKQLKDEYD